MGNNGWKDISTCPIAESKEDARYIIVWHVFQGAMVYSTLKARENRFNVYWQEPPTEWIDPHDRLPTKEDADPQSCILVIDSHGDLSVRGWHQVEKPSDVRKWAPRPLRRTTTGNCVQTQIRRKHDGISQHRNPGNQRA